MGLSAQQAAEEMKNAKELYLAFCRFTNLPYVTEGEESANDQAWVFTSESQIKEFGKKKLEEKIVLLGMKYEKKNYEQMFRILYAVDVNAVLYHNGKEEVEIGLEELYPAPDYSGMEEKKRPLYNPGLQLCGIYFLQKLRRPVKAEERGDLRELEEEFLVNLDKAAFLVPMQVDPKNPKRIIIPLVKNNKGEMMQPAFTDQFELEKFTKGKRVNAVKFTFQDLRKLLKEQVKWVIINPMGFNLPMDQKLFDRVERLTAE